MQVSCPSICKAISPKRFDRCLVFDLEGLDGSDTKSLIDFRCKGDSSSTHPRPRVTSLKKKPSQAQQAACWTDLGSCADNAFDGKIETGWESACSPCDQKQAWVGLRFGMAVEIKCFRILQSEDVQQLGQNRGG